MSIQNSLSPLPYFFEAELSCSTTGWVMARGKRRPVTKEAPAAHDPRTTMVRSHTNFCVMLPLARGAATQKCHSLQESALRTRPLASLLTNPLKPYVSLHLRDDSIKSNLPRVNQ